MRVVKKVVLTISEDTEGKQIIFKRDDALAEQKLDGFTRAASSIFNIEMSSNEDMSFGDVDIIRHVYIEADGDFNLVFSGGTDILAVKLADTVVGRKAIFDADVQVTQVNIANPSATAELNGAYAVYGDLAP